MAYIRKTRDRWDLMANYGYGWDVECSEYTYKDAKQTLKEYRENGSGLYRLEKHREKLEPAPEKIRWDLFTAGYYDKDGGTR